MKKINVAIFSIFCLSLTFYSVLWPSYYQELLIASDSGLLVLRTMVCAFMVAYAFRPQVRTYFARTLMRAGGITLLLFGITTFISPGLFGVSVAYVPIADTFIFLEGGILALLLSLELPAHNAPSPSLLDKNLRYFASLLATQPKKLTRTDTVRSTTR